MVKSISIFGSTGSIGKNAIEVILNSRQSYKVIGLVANRDLKTLVAQAKLLKPQFVASFDPELYLELKLALENLPEIKVMAGESAIREIAKIKCDIFISAIVGLAALIPTIEAIRAGSNIGLANKECLVAAGNLILEEAKKTKAKIIPIDSEHNAIFQVFENQNLDLIEDITLTASGGPFLKTNLEAMKNITKEQALKHPKWQMGAKISIDSATMMNKGLEMIEAYHLFPIKKEQIKILVHPESIIHGLVSYKDGSSLAMLSKPDMKIPIAYAIGNPLRIAIQHQKLDLTEISTLNFFRVDEKKFPALKLAREAMYTGGNATCILNAANEIAVDKFLKDQISFIEITKIVMAVLEKIPYRELTSLEEVIAFDNQARKIANEYC